MLIYTVHELPYCTLKYEEEKKLSLVLVFVIPHGSINQRHELRYLSPNHIKYCCPGNGLQSAI